MSDARREYSAAVVAGCMVGGFVLLALAVVAKCLGLPLG